MSPEETLVSAVQQNDLDAAVRALAFHGSLRARLNEPLPGLPFGATILQPAVHWKNREMVSFLLLSGADINVKTHWWAGGFTVLDFAEPDFVPFLLAQGAVMTPHAAARLGRLDDLRRIVHERPEAARARGGDGQTPLHMASTVEIAAFLLDAGAEIDALDVDHESTPAQYRVREHPDVARYLVGRGATADLLLSSALGDVDRVRAIVDADPAAVSTSVTDAYFPMRHQRAGGHIYTWSLGKYKTAHIVAREFGHDDVYRLLMDRTSPAPRLALAVELGDDEAARPLLADNPGFVEQLSDAERRRLSYAAQENNTAAVRRMLEAGWPVDVRGQHGATALHWAAFHGNAEMTRAILTRAPSLEAKDHDHQGTPLAWAFHGSEHGWHCETGDYVGTVEALLDAGAQVAALDQISASEPVRALLEREGRG